MLSQTSWAALGKWLAGILATVVAAIAVFWITRGLETRDRLTAEILPVPYFMRASMEIDSEEERRKHAQFNGLLFITLHNSGDTVLKDVRVRAKGAIEYARPKGAVYEVLGNDPDGIMLGEIPQRQKVELLVWTNQGEAYRTKSNLDEQFVVSHSGGIADMNIEFPPASQPSASPLEVAWSALSFLTVLALCGVTIRLSNRVVRLNRKVVDLLAIPKDDSLEVNQTIAELKRINHDLNQKIQDVMGLSEQAELEPVRHYSSADKDRIAEVFHQLREILNSEADPLQLEVQKIWQIWNQRQSKPTDAPLNIDNTIDRLMAVRAEASRLSSLLFKETLDSNKSYEQLLKSVLAYQIPDPFRKMYQHFDRIRGALESANVVYKESSDKPNEIAAMVLRILDPFSETNAQVNGWVHETLRRIEEQEQLVLSRG